MFRGISHVDVVDAARLNEVVSLRQMYRPHSPPFRASYRWIAADILEKLLQASHNTKQGDKDSVIRKARASRHVLLSQRGIPADPFPSHLSRPRPIFSLLVLPSRSSMIPVSNVYVVAGALPSLPPPE